MAPKKRLAHVPPPKEETLTCRGCRGPIDDTGACVRPVCEKCDRSTFDVADRSPVAPDEEEQVQVKGLDSFEDGIVFALELLKSQVRAGEEECRQLAQGASSIVGQQINATQQTLVGVLVNFETALMKGVSERRSRKGR